MKSIVIEGMLFEEYERNNRMYKKYYEELIELPKGSIVKRCIGSEIYCYLHYRENNKIISKYIGKENSINVIELEKDIEKRKKLLNIIKKLKIEKAELEKILKIK